LWSGVGEVGNGEGSMVVVFGGVEGLGRVRSLGVGGGGFECGGDGFELG